MNLKIKAQKKSMHQIFLEDGQVVPVTEIVLLEKSDQFQTGDMINVQGIAKGKGFAGVVKRWGFKGGPKTHGQKNKHRAPGSIGAGTDPGRVWKGQKMPGRMGNQRVTVKNLDVMQVVMTEDQTRLLLKGAVPGRPNSQLLLSKNCR